MHHLLFNILYAHIEKENSPMFSRYKLEYCDKHEAETLPELIFKDWKKSIYTTSALSSGFLRISVFPKRLRQSAFGCGLNVLETCSNSTEMQCSRVSCFLIVKASLIIPF